MARDRKGRTWWLIGVGILRTGDGCCIGATITIFMSLLQPPASAMTHGDGILFI